MKTRQYKWDSSAGWSENFKNVVESKPQLVLVFGSREAIKDQSHIQAIRTHFPNAQMLGCSTAGEILGARVYDDSLAVTGVEFEKTKIAVQVQSVERVEDSFRVGERLSSLLSPDGLVHVFILSDGLHVNGSDLVRGVSAGLPSHVTVTGGLSGDAARFQETVVLCNGDVRSKTVAIVGFYGTDLKIGYGSLGGWDVFGPKRKITKSKGNVLFEMDGQSALDLYKKYLGEHAAGLPATGLLFPLCLVTKDNKQGAVRTILAVDDAAKSMTFAGDLPEEQYVYLMKANFDRLIDGASNAAKNCQKLQGEKTDLGLLISCVGRKLILKQRIEEEVEAVGEVLGQACALTGFYSYGEIAPFVREAKCELHNQTMTITTLTES